MMAFQRPRCVISLICFLLAFGACRVADEGEDDPQFTVDPEYAIDLFEQRNPADGTPTFGLWVERLELSACEGYGIDMAMQIAGNNIEVALLGVAPPAAPCTGDSAPARQFLPIGHLADGIYGLNISLRDVVVNEGTLTASNGRYILSMPAVKGINIENYALESLPDGIVWGYAAMPDESAKPAADHFIADLKTLTADDGLAPGYYGYFTVAGTGNVFFHKSIASKVAAEQFVRRLTASADDLKALLQNYRNAAPLPLTIKCWTTGGEL